MIEDSLHGIQAAQAAHMRCLAIATTHPAHEIHGADLVLRDLRDFSWAAWRGLFPVSCASGHERPS